MYLKKEPSSRRWLNHHQTNQRASDLNATDVVNASLQNNLQSVTSSGALAFWINEGA
jgi:hypothetical protein